MWKTKILQATNKIFENAWETEKSRISEMLDRYSRSEHLENREVYAVTADIRKNYNNIDKKTYKEVQSMRSIIRKVAVHGQEEALQDICKEYKNAMIAKLEKSLGKHDFECDAISVDVKNSPQGYCITSILSNGNIFETNCVGVGGYNIVSFHYRYTHKIKSDKNNVMQEVEKEVRAYTDNKIIFREEPIPSNHLLAIRGVFCDFFECQDYANVYVKK